MFYTIYQVTNKINAKIYIGKHQTTDLEDGYMGSGKLLRRSQEKYGIDNFEKKILFVFDSEDEMNAKEKELVTEEFCSFDHTYNLCEGGKGGFGYINANPDVYLTGKRLGALWSNKQRTTRWKQKYENDAEFRQRMTECGRNGLAIARSNNPNGIWYGRKHNEETKQKMRKSKNFGSQNSQFGSMWITNGTENKKIKSIDIIPETWYKGRVINK